MFAAALLLYSAGNFVAKLADNFAMKGRSGSMVQIHSAPPSSLSVSGHLGESIEIRACARDLRSRADPENALVGVNRQNLAKPIPARFRYLHLRILTRQLWLIINLRRRINRLGNSIRFKTIHHFLGLSKRATDEDRAGLSWLADFRVADFFLRSETMGARR